MLLIFFTFQLFVLGVTKIEAQRQIELKIKGSIVIYDVTPEGYNLNYSGASKIYVVKVSKIITGKVDSDYLFVVTNKKFNKGDFKIKKTFEFKLQRAKACDDKIRSFRNLFETEDERYIPRVRLSSGVTLEGMPLDETLPCYVLRWL